MNRLYKKVVLVLLLPVVLTGALSCRKAETGRVVQKQLVYKKVGDRELRLDIFEPERRKGETALPAVILFHGGGWYRGEPNGLYPHCRYFAGCGMVAISAQYRLSKDGNSPPIEAVEDTKSAVRYVRVNAANLGINPDKIAAGGASAGGHLAACTALFDKFDAAGEDQKISSKPNALVLISAALDTTPEGFTPRILRKLGRNIGWVRRADANELSPVCHIRKIAAPCLVLHGTMDDLVPFEIAERFCKLMKEAGNTCQLAALAGAGHGFSVYEPEGDNRQFGRAMRIIEEFFRSQGFLKGQPKL